MAESNTFADNMAGISNSYRTAAGLDDKGNVALPDEEVQRQNRSEHAGDERGEPVTPPEATKLNTVNDGAETSAAFRPADEATEPAPEKPAKKAAAKKTAAKKK